MSKDDMISAEGTVIQVLPDTKFKVKLDNSQHIVTAYLSGKLRTNYIKILEGDRVKVELTPYDMTKARIVYRNKN